MAQNYISKQEQLLRRQRKRQRWRKVVSVMGGAVVFVTTYALILPAITMVKTEKVLTCPVEIHKHNESCYDSSVSPPKLICGEADFVIHEHDEYCYDAEGNLICTLPDIPAHVHDESCYAEEKILKCGSTEGDGHHHTDACYQMPESDDDFIEVDQHGNFIFSDFAADRELICGKEETDVVHTHTDACYELEKKLICTNQAILHKHDKEKCYEKIELKNGKVEYNLICTEMEVLEHKHGDGCFTTVTVDTPDDSEENTESIENGIIVEDELSIEEENPIEDGISMETESSTEEENLTADGILMDDTVEEKFSEETVNELVLLPGVNTVHSGDILRLTNVFSEEETFLHNWTILEILPDDMDTNPELDNFRLTPCENSAILENLISGQITVQHEYNNEYSDLYILNVEEATEEDVTTDQVACEFEQIFEGSDYTITVRYNSDAEIPVEAVLMAMEIDPESEEYASYYAQTADAMGIETNPASEAEDPTEISEEDLNFEPEDEPRTEEVLEQEKTITEITFARFFDIGFYSGETCYEPAAAVDVAISYKEPIDLQETDNATVIHFAESGVELLDVETSQNEETIEAEENAVDTFTFTQESFSVTGTVVTGTTTNALPNGDYMIVMKYGNNYYALTNGLKPTKVNFSNNTVTFDDPYMEPDVFLWTLEGSNTSRTIRKVTNPRDYLSLTANAVTTATNSTSLNVGYNNGWYIRRGTTYNNTYLNLSSEDAFSMGNTRQQVYFVNNVRYAPIEPNPQLSLDGSYEHNKYIDYLGDGDTNVLTTLTGEDLYRLSLDMTGIRKPVDMLMVIDTSGSMKGSGPSSNPLVTNGMPYLIRFLNGGTSTGTYNYNDQIDTFNDTTANGFINEFFTLNSQNRLAMVGFGGYDPNQRQPNGIGYVDMSSNANYQYTDDAWIIKDWNPIGQPYTSVPVKKGYYPDFNSTNLPTRSDRAGGPGLYIEDSGWVQGTNYSAGIMMAQDMFDKLEQLGDGGTERIRILVFLSDGMPTYSITPAGSEYPTFNSQHYMRRGQGQNRYYKNNNESTSTGTPRTNDCYYDSEQTFETYHTAHPDVINYSIAFRTSGTGVDDVLQYMGSTDATRTNAVNFSKASNENEILTMVLGVFKPRDVTITDRLTDFVDLYETQPDVKVTMTPKDGGDPILLWNGYNTGSGTSANTFVYQYYNANNILQSENRSIVTGVKYIDKHIVAQFDEHYTLNQDYTYAVSFNVKATATAYDAYALANGNYPVVGDAGTDWGTNETSSGKNGLHSNVAAVVSYINTDPNARESLGYKMPVIQSDRCDLLLHKVDQTGTPLVGAKFELKKGDQVIGTYTVENADGTILIPSNVLTTGSYTLKETQAPEECEATEEIIEFSVEKGMIQSDPLPDTSDWNWGAPVLKVTGDKNGVTTYPKDQLYEYNLTVTNHRIIRSYDIILQKVNENGTPLGGAEFALYKDVTNIPTDDSVKVEKTYIFAGESKDVKVELLAAGLISQKQTITIQGTNTEIDAVIYSGILEEGTYYLEETHAPDGYNSLTEPVIIQIDQHMVSYIYRGSQITNKVIEAGEISSAKIKNSRGYNLPHTGGPGTTLYTMSGMLLIGIGLLYGFILRRKQERRMI